MKWSIASSFPSAGRAVQLLKQIGRALEISRMFHYRNHGARWRVVVGAGANDRARKSG